MLPGEINLPEVSFASQSTDVNELFNQLCIESDTWLARRFAQAFQQLQNDLYGKLNNSLCVRTPDPDVSLYSTVMR